MKKLVKLYRWLTNLGVTADTKIEEAQRIRLGNILAISPVIIYLFFIWYGLRSPKLNFLSVICGALLICVIVGLFLSYKHKTGISKSIILSVNSLGIFVNYNCFLANYSGMCYFFPVIIAYMMVYDIKKEWMLFFPTFIFTLLCIACCLLLPKYLFIEHSNLESYLNLFNILNFLFSTVLSVVFMFIIIQIQSSTQQKLIEARETSEMANKAKSVFLSNMSHELRTPLNGIIGGVNLLMHENATLSQKRYYEILEHSSRIMINLINNILDFSKINEGKINLDRNVFNMHDELLKICRVHETQNTGKDVNFIYEIDKRLNAEFISDDLRLNQILINLLTNANKFTKKGQIIFKALVEEERTANMSILFSVKDTGVGIRPEQLEKIFESFEQADQSTTRNFGGTGLGLSISKGLVSLFSSQLHVKSKLGEGSEFYFSINAELNTGPVALQAEQTEIVRDLTGLRLLVAEDNKTNMMVLRNFLKKWKVTFDEVGNGAEALNQFNKNEYHVILLDIEMPVMDGYTALDEIRKIDSDIPVIAFTAALFDNMHESLSSRGFSDCIHKPFKPLDLYAKIVKYDTLGSQRDSIKKEIDKPST
jgi:signal transduction histidine kinase/AmiR/NasT family two-component response regulator